MKDRTGALTNISALFETYKRRLKPPQRSVEKVASEVIGRVVGRPLSPEQVSYTVATKTLYIKVPAVLRQTILLQREALLTALKETLGNEAPLQIL